MKESGAWRAGCPVRKIAAVKCNSPRQNSYPIKKWNSPAELAFGFPNSPLDISQDLPPTNTLLEDGTKNICCGLSRLGKEIAA